MFQLASGDLAIVPLRALLAILAFRLFPFAAYVTLTQSYSWLIRCAAVLGYLALSVLAGKMGAQPLTWLLLAYGYCSFAGWVTFELAPFVRSRAAWFVAVTVLFWALPLLVVRPTPMVFLVVGWEATLSAYSYGVDAGRNADRSLRSLLFFLLVNPALVYRNSGRRVSAPMLDGAGIVRFALGVLAVFLAVSVFAWPLQGSSDAGIEEKYLCRVVDPRDGERHGARAFLTKP
jgi:hypothetical protein